MTSSRGRATKRERERERERGGGERDPDPGRAEAGRHYCIDSGRCKRPLTCDLFSQQRESERGSSNNSQMASDERERERERERDAREKEIGRRGMVRESGTFCVH